MASLVVLEHECQRGRRQRNYIVDALAADWARRGVEVEFIYGLDRRPPADLLLQHVDLTRTPAEYVALIRSYPHVVNGGLLDISKSRISGQLVRAGDGYDGPVILKTDENYGGRPEERVARWRRPIRTALQRKLAACLETVLRRPYGHRRTLDSYPVFTRPGDVPPAALRNPALLLERFLPEQDGSTYFLRHYVFLGDRGLTSKVGSPTPFMKRASCFTVERDFPVPPAVLAFRRSFGADYGKIDYVERDGRPYVLDLNRTPSLPGSPEADDRVVRGLADGIFSLFSPNARDTR